jgi:hypothetical protein
MRNKKTLLRRSAEFSGFLLALIFFGHASLYSASMADTIATLQSQFEKTKESVMMTIQSVPDHPDLVESGSLDATLSMKQRCAELQKSRPPNRSGLRMKAI